MTEALPARPAPPPSAMTAGFWEAAARRELVRPVCNSCGRSFFVPQPVCTHCLSGDWDYQASSGRGEVYSATVVHRAPFPGIEAPFHLAIVDLEEGWSMLSNIVDERQGPVPIGTPVEVVWLQSGDRVFPLFAVLEGAA